MTKYPVKEIVEEDAFFSDLRMEAEQFEEQTLHSNASFSKNHLRFNGSENDQRLPYKRDVDRIVHSKSFARYSEKTQVVYMIENDHITKRGLHVQFVNNYARGIGQILRYNLDLVEAIALGHDVGHPPFGHEGEEYLSRLSEEYGNGKYAHPYQSCRLFSVIEPLNLGLAVYDGFLCHDGGMNGSVIKPNFGKTWEVHREELQLKKADPDKNILPGTLEGCLVKLCDTVSYLGKDFEDAIMLKLIHREELPETCLGNTNREMLSHVSRDIIKSSYGKDYIAVSDETYEALIQIRKFNFERIYRRPEIKVESVRVQRAYHILFETLVSDFSERNKESFLWREFLHNKPMAYIEETSPVQMVVDFISGMTDRYFVRTLEKLTVPSLIRLSS